MRQSGLPLSSRTGAPSSKTTHPGDEPITVIAPAAEHPLTAHPVASLDSVGGRDGIDPARGGHIEVRVHLASNGIVEVPGVDARVAPDERAPGNRGVGSHQRLDCLDLLHRRHLGTAPDLRHVHPHDAGCTDFRDDVIGQATQPVILGGKVLLADAGSEGAGVLQDLRSGERWARLGADRGDDTHVDPPFRNNDGRSRVMSSRARAEWLPSDSMLRLSFLIE